MEPISCSLDAANLETRQAEIEAIGSERLVEIERAGGRATLRFIPGADSDKRLSRLVAAEAECCPFLRMTLRDSDEAVVLTIEAPGDAEPVLDDLILAFA